MIVDLRHKNILHLQDVLKKYGPKMVLDDIDLSVEAGELCVVVGPSGCGKSTLLRLILGQEMPTSGEILLEGLPIGFANSERGIVYQRYSLFPNLTVLKNVLIGLELSSGFWERRRKKKTFEEQAMYYLDRVHLAKHAHKYPHELSGGMQQRVAIAQAMIMKPKILMMDEPFGALDPGTREDMQVFLLELWEETKKTIFFVTHDLEEAVFLGTRIIVLSQHYRDDRGESPDVNRGSKIVFDKALPRRAMSTNIKRTADFGELIHNVRQSGFDPTHRSYVTEFDLTHPDSFQTLDSDVAHGFNGENRLEVGEKK